MGEPGAAEALLRFEHDEARAGALLGEVIGAADPGDAGPDDHDVEVLGLLRCGFGHRGAVCDLCWNSVRILDRAAGSIGAGPDSPINTVRSLQRGRLVGFASNEAPGKIRSCAEFDFDPDVVSHWEAWLGHRRPKLLAVGQDFGNVGYFVRNRGRDEPHNKTNDNLRKLLREAGFDVTNPSEATGARRYF